MLHSCCHCCCGNPAWQCVRQVNFRQNKLFLNSVGKTDWFCLKMNSFALWKYSDQINIYSPHSNSEIGLFKYFGTISISHTSLVNVFFYTFPKWCEGQMRRWFHFFPCISSGLLGLHPQHPLKELQNSPFIFQNIPLSLKCWFNYILCFLLSVFTFATVLMSSRLLPSDYH